MKKFLLIFLTLCMIVGICSGCRKQPEPTPGGDTGSGNATVSREPELTPDLPDLEPYDRDFRIMQRTAPFKQEWDPDLESTDVLSDAMFERNSYVENKYKITFLISSYALSEANSIKTMMLSNDNSFELLDYSPLFISAWSQQDLLRDIGDLPYVNYSQPWWYSDMMEKLGVDNSRFLAFGYANLSSMYTATAVFYNKEIWSAYYTDNIYDIVSNHNWDLATMLEYAQGLYLDRDSIPGASQGDRYGIIYDGGGWYTTFFGAGLPIVSKDANGKLVSNLSSEVVINRISEIVRYSNDRGITRKFISDDEFDEWKDFASGGSLFLLSTIKAVDTLRRNMVADYGILPAPLLEQGQEHYYSQIHPNHSSAFSVSKNVPTEDLEMIGVILEESNYASRRYQLPVLIDTCLKGNIARDEGTTEMIDLIFSALCYDPMFLYDTNDIDSSIRSMIENNPTAIGSTLKVCSDLLQANLDERVNYKKK